MAQMTAPTALQLYTGDEQERLNLLKDYRPHDHIASWKANDRGTNRTVNYYPAAWRLYELSLRYPFANFSSEIVHKDSEKNFVVVRVRLYLGPSYEDSPKKAEAHKQGPLSELDKVETKAKARCARDFGIGTEHALDMDDAEADAVNDAPVVIGNGRKVVEADQPAAQPKAAPGTEHLTNGDGSPAFPERMKPSDVEKLYSDFWLWTGLDAEDKVRQRWEAWKSSLFKQHIADQDLTAKHGEVMHERLAAAQEKKVASGK